MTTITLEDRNLLITENLFLADKIAKSKKRKLSHISYEELQSAAYLGLVEAAQNYHPDENDCFAAFAVWRIIGAVRDYLRELSWGSRSTPRNVVPIETCEDELCTKEDSIDVEFFEDFIKHLPASNKTVMRLYYLEAKKIAEIAEIFGCHQSRISQLLSDSRNKLNSAWSKRQPELWALVA